MVDRPVIAIVVGGVSGEHEVSLMSGTEVLAHTDRRRWSPFVVRVDPDGAWCFPAYDVRGTAERLPIGDGIKELLARRPDAVFPVMHGPYGEDGKFQSLLELLELPYVGSPAESSAFAMNKARARDVLSCAGLRVPAGEELVRGQAPTLTAPCVVKPMRMGSSLGLAVVPKPELLADAIADAFRHDERVLIEAFVDGRELTAGILEEVDGTPVALPLIEIRPKTSAFFDYEAKYTPGASDEICPAPVSDAIREEVQEIARVAHHALGCRGMSRTDVIVDPAGTPWVLETNTIPGMTTTSLLPQAAAVAGIDFPALIDRLIDRTLSGSPR